MVHKRRKRIQMGSHGGEVLAFTIEKKGYPALVVSDNPSELKETLTILTLKVLSSDWIEQNVKALLPT